MAYGGFWFPRGLLDRYGDRLGPGPIAVYCALLRLADGGQECTATYRDLSLLTGIRSINTLRKHLHALSSLGLIQIAPRGRTMAYRLMEIPLDGGRSRRE